MEADLKVLVVEDSDLKYRDIESALEFYEITDITRRKSRNGALKELMEANKSKNRMYDVVILDMQIPLFETGSPDILKAGGVSIMYEIERRGWETFICFCSSDDVSKYYIDEDEGYIIKYDPSVSILGDIKDMLEKAKEWKLEQSSE